jgi:5-methylcytosine-specific restriction endonuclease McrA
MATKGSGRGKPSSGKISRDDMDRIIARARQTEEERLKSYRERSLRIHPWICARCGREFTTKNLNLLTVHHKDHNHENNPPDGSNWENLCIYCHDNEHSRYLDHQASGETQPGDEKRAAMSHKPFAALGELLKKTSDQ